MKTYAEAIDHAVDDLVNWHDAKYAYRQAVVSTIAYMFNMDIDQVRHDLYATEERQTTLIKKQRADARKKQYQAENEARRLANLAKR